MGVPAAVDVPGRVGLPRQDGLTHPQRQVDQAWVRLHEEVLYVLGTGTQLASRSRSPLVSCAKLAR